MPNPTEKLALAEKHLARVLEAWEEPDWADRWPTPNARQWVLGFLQRAENDPNVVSVVAVGSAVRGGVASEDVDLVVICSAKAKCEERPPIEVDLRVFERDDVEARLSEGQDLLAWAVKFGEALYDGCDYWTSLKSRWEGRIPLPDPDVARERAASARAYLDRMEEVGDDDAARDLRISYLTHLARAELSEAGVYPASRPELPAQLREMGAHELARSLSRALAAREKAAKGPAP